MVRKIKAKLVLRLRSEGLTGRQIAEQGMSRTSVAMVLDAADREGCGFMSRPSRTSPDAPLRAEASETSSAASSAM